MIKSRRMRKEGHAARMGKKRIQYSLLVRKPVGNKPLGRPRRTWVENIRMDLGETGWDGTDWIDVDQDRNKWIALVNAEWETIEWLHKLWPLE
jgi:hypothetical protein